MKNFYKMISARLALILALIAMPAMTIAQMDSAYFVSDSTWFKSTVVTPSTVFGTWPGVAGVLPDTSTYTIPAPVGQPYGYFSIDTLGGADVIKTDSNITYFRKEISLDTLTDLSARIRINVDDQMEIYINGEFLAGEYEAVKRSNWNNPSYDALIQDDGTIINGYMGGDTIDSVSTVDLDSLFHPGVNEIVVVCRNLSNFNNKGGFCFRLDIKGVLGIPTIGFFASDSTTFVKSSVVTPTIVTYNWSGVSGSFPPDSTYTEDAVEGQPYGYHSIDAVADAKVIKTESNDIVYYRGEFDITTKDSLNARFRATVDDNIEIYINGFLIARESNMTKWNRQAPAHDVKFFDDGTKINGFMGGDMYNFTTSSAMGDVFLVGTNTIDLVIRNQPKAGDRGGFSFRMDLDAGGEEVIVDNKTSELRRRIADGNAFTADVYPNPSSGKIKVMLEGAVDFDVYVYDLNGRLLRVKADNSYDTTMDISDLTSGIYFVKVISNNRSYTTKVMKQ